MSQIVDSCPAELRPTFKALAHETGLIQGFGEKTIAKTPSFLKEMIPQEQDNVNEGVDPVEHVEYHFFSEQDTDYTAVQTAGANTTAEHTVRQGDGTEETITITENTGDNVMCDPPKDTLVAGYNVYTGVRFHKALETPVQCALDLTRRKHVAYYIEGLRRAMPREMDYAFQKKLEQLVLQFGRSNSSEVRGNLKMANGFIPGEPDGTIDYGTLKVHSEALRAQGWTGPIEYAMSETTLRRMILNYNTNAGGVYHVQPFGNDFNFEAGSRVSWGGLVFRVIPNPPVGYIKQTGATTYEFVRVDPRKIQAGSGGGMTLEYDAIYQRPVLSIQGKQYRLVEMIYFVHPMAVRRRGFAVPQIPGFSPDTRWNMEVKLVAGPYIECNEHNRKFKFVAEHNFKLVPLDPRLMGGIAALYEPFRRYHNQPQEIECDTETIEVSAQRLPQPPDNDCCTIKAMEGDEDFDPQAPRPIVPTEDDPDPTNVAGVFVPECTVNVTYGADSVFICVERKSGSLGAVSIDYATADGTAAAATDYDAASGTLSWANLEGGIKCVEITGLTGGAGNKAFTVNWSNATGAALAAGACAATTVNIGEVCA